MRITLCIFVVVISTAMTGCYSLQWSDISSEQPISSLMNTLYETKNELLIYGITLDSNYKNTIDYYTVKNPPGISGPEVVSENTLPKGSVVKIIRAERCNNCLPFFPKERLIVEILSSNKFTNSIVVLSYNNKISINDDSDLIKIVKTHNKALNMDSAKSAAPVS